MMKILCIDCTGDNKYIYIDRQTMINWTLKMDSFQLCVNDTK